MRRALGIALALACAACAGSSRLERSDRAVAPEQAQLDWLPAEPADLLGLFESVSIEGEAASALWKVYYHFAADGSYTGAALVIGGSHPEFQTLSGSWTLAHGILDLGQDERLSVRAAPDHLELESSGGIAILRRVELQ